MKNKIIGLILAVLACISVAVYFLWPRTEPDKEYIVGILNPNKGTQQICEGFMEGLLEYAEVDGKKINFIKAASPELCRLEDCMHNFLDRNVDLIFAVTTPAAKKAKEMAADKGVPIIFAMYDPVDSGVVQELSRPGGNISGIKISGGTSKSLEWYVKVFPRVKNVYVPVAFDSMAARQSLDELQQAADSLGVELIVAEVETEENLQAALGAIPPDVEGIFLLHSILITSHTRDIINEAIKRKMPTGASSSQCEDGVAVCFSIDLKQTGRKASRLAHQVMTTASADDIPVEAADLYLTINMQTIEAIGADIPNDILQLADTIIR